MTMKAMRRMRTMMKILKRLLNLLKKKTTLPKNMFMDATKRKVLAVEKVNSNKLKEEKENK